MYRNDIDASRGERGAEDVYSYPVKAGKRTYFFDVKTTKGRKDFYLTITESKRHTAPDGSYTYDKHKIFLYKEDFEKFREGLEEAVRYVKDDCFGGEIPIKEYEPHDHDDF
jgi:hypothetical protein